MTRTRTVTRPIWTLGLLSLFVRVASSTAQVPVELTIDGLAAVSENSSADYTATALFDNGQEFEVTLFCDWFVDPDTYASIDQFGRLTTQEVPKNQQIVVMASFTWDEVTVDDELDVTIIDVPPDEGLDPWPFWGRTPTRLGRTATIGPQTPTIAWSVQFSTHWSESIREASPVMDAQGRLFVGTAAGVSAVESKTRQVLWEAQPGDVTRGPAVCGGRVVWGDVSPFSTLYCYDAATGQEHWRFETGGAMFAAPVIDPNGVIYISDAGAHVIHARRIEDGSEVWTFPVRDTSFNSTSLDWPFLLVSAGDPRSADLLGLNPDTGTWRWSAFTGAEVFGTAPIHDDRVYVGSGDWSLYCFDAVTGDEVWNIGPFSTMRGAVAIGHDDTIYALTSGGEGIGRLIAVTPDGDLLWEYFHLSQTLNAPIVGGDGTIYLCSQNSAGRRGRVHAMRPDGSELWIRDMPDQVSASPMLAPDGTLYIVCRDKNLYAFRDPVGDLDFDGDIDLDDFAKFEECLTGPRLWGEAAKTTPGCELLDFDSDWDVDFTDFAQFQLAFTGP